MLLVAEVQLPAQLPDGLVALLRGEGAGLHDDPLQLPAAVYRRGKALPRETAVGRLLALEGGGNGGGIGEEGQGSQVHHPIENHTQGIDVRLRAVMPAICHLRGHITHGARHRSRGGLFGHLGNAKIPQFELAFLGYQDVLRLDITVDDLMLLAGQQGVAHLQPQPKHNTFPIFRTQHLLQRAQQLHTDVNIPADAVVVLHTFHVVTGNYIFAAV